MKLNRQFWTIFFSFTPSFIVVALLLEYFFPGEKGFHLLEELKHSALIGAFVSIGLYFNRYTLKGEMRKKYQARKRGDKQ